MNVTDRLPRYHSGRKTMTTLLGPGSSKGGTMKVSRRLEFLVVASDGASRLRNATDQTQDLGAFQFTEEFMRFRLQVFNRLTLAAVLLFSALPAHATFPGKNGLITFQVQTDAGVQIYTVRPNGDDLRQITNVDGDAVAPDWSPDGRQYRLRARRPGYLRRSTIIDTNGTGIMGLSPDPNVCEGDPVVCRSRRVAKYIQPF